MKNSRCLMYREIKEHLKEADIDKGYKKDDSHLTYYKSPRGREYYKSDYTASLEDRKPNKVFVPGDRVIISKGTNFNGTIGLEGKTGIITSSRFIGAYPQITMEFDIPLNDAYKTDSWILGEEEVDFYDENGNVDFTFNW